MRARTGKAIATIAAAAALACAAEPPPVAPPPSTCHAPRPLVDADRWTLVPAAEDPFRREPGPSPDADAGAPDDAGTSADSGAPLTRGRCGPLDAQPELLAGEPSFSVVTLRCAWATAEAPIEADVPAGAPLTLRIWHFSQLRIVDATAHLVLALEDRVLWETRVPLPSEGALITATTSVAAPITRGTRLRWHVANHGDNSWNFLSLTAELDGPCPASP